jgi:hypothetical protein
MNEKNPDPSKTSTKLSLAELLARSLEDDELVDNAVEQERWDEDEGSFGG